MNNVTAEVKLQSRTLKFEGPEEYVIRTAKAYGQDPSDDYRKRYSQSKGQWIELSTMPEEYLCRAFRKEYLEYIGSLVRDNPEVLLEAISGPLPKKLDRMRQALTTMVEERNRINELCDQSV